jgi:hypothetical protein
LYWLGMPTLQLREKFFNLFNTPQFDKPGATAGSAAIGIVYAPGSESTFQRIERKVRGDAQTLSVATVIYWT